MDHQSSFLQLDTVLRSIDGGNMDSFLHTPEGLDSLMASLPQDQQKYFLEDDIFTPLMSPAITPSMGYYSNQNIPGSLPQEVDITPLTSPAIMPQPNDLTSGNIYEQYEQLERAKQMITRRLSELQKKRPREDVPPTIHHQQHYHPSYNQQYHHQETARAPISPAGSPCIEPVTISSLMNIKATTATTTPTSFKRARRTATQHDHVPSPRPLKPLLISPTLVPGPPILFDAEHRLTTRSNYQNFMEGKATALGIGFSSHLKSGLEVRRTAHKAAEQKRRDSLKEWFERLRNEVDEGYVKHNVPSDEIEDETKPLSKVLLLKYAYEYISLLKSTIDERDMRIDQLEKQLDNVKK